VTELPVLKKQLQLILNKSERSIAVAQRNMNDGYYDFASSRAYYAVFYVMQAALLTKNLSFSKHSAVISAFNQHFVKTLVFPKDFSKLITRLFRERQIGDYDFESGITENDVQRDIEAAEIIMQAVKTYLIDKELL
jgi:uncharacterized protein (UPF0332 family)